MPTDTDAGDRPGTPEQYDREAAWSRFVAACAKCQTWPEGKAVFFAELDAAVVWATRRERERAAKIVLESDFVKKVVQVDDLYERKHIDRQATLESIAARIRSDSDTPAQENSK
jgi:hypothetical protein